jgi:hypothetical protein
MALTRLIYASQPFGFDDATLAQILFKARQHNGRDGVTGALIVRADLYLQLLEGEQEKVEATWQRIAQDDRHTAIHRLSLSPISERLFPGWAMRDDPARSWMWDRRAVAAGAVEKAHPDTVLDVFVRLSQEPREAPPRCPHH